MANIVYGKSLNPVGKDNAKSRRNARRAEEAIKAREIEAILASAFSQEAPQRRVELSRAEIACKRPAADRVVKAVETETEYHKQILAGAAKYMGGEISSGMCIPDVALYQAGHRKVRKDATHIVK